MSECTHIDHLRLGPGIDRERDLEQLQHREVKKLVMLLRKELNMQTRCKVYVESVKLTGTDGKTHTGEEVQMRAVQGDKVSKGYPTDGSDEDNTYAKFSPSADFRLYVANPHLFGQFKPGQKYYIDMTPAEPPVESE